MDEPWVKHNRVNVVLQDLTPLFVFVFALFACSQDLTPSFVV